MMYKKVKIQYSLGDKQIIFELGGIQDVQEFTLNRLKRYGPDAEIVDIQDDPESDMWVKAYEQDKRYKYN